jgi:predicted transcriptional regulator YdeE
MNPILPYTIDADILVMTELAEDFGKGIGESFVRLAEKLHTPGEKRDCYGIVDMPSTGMRYRAAFTELKSGEAIEKNLPQFVIPCGHYASITIENWNQKMMEIGPTFDQILKSGKADRSAPCIEFYKTETELICMVKSVLR